MSTLSIQVIIAVAMLAVIAAITMILGITTMSTVVVPVVIMIIGIAVIAAIAYLALRVIGLPSWGLHTLLVSPFVGATIGMIMTSRFVRNSGDGNTWPVCAI